MGAGLHGGFGNTAGLKNAFAFEITVEFTEDGYVFHKKKLDEKQAERKRAETERAKQKAVEKAEKSKQEAAEPSIDSNVEKMKKDYPYTKYGYFGKKGRNSRVIETTALIETSRDFYEKIGKGGNVEKLPNVKGTKTVFPDGTVVTYRQITKTPDSPAVDINISYSKYIKTQKIHFIRGEEK